MFYQLKNVKSKTTINSSTDYQIPAYAEFIRIPQRNSVRGLSYAEDINAQELARVMEEMYQWGQFDPLAPFKDQASRIKRIVRTLGMGTQVYKRAVDYFYERTGSIILI